jgi:hypothetical protein
MLACEARRGRTTLAHRRSGEVDEGRKKAMIERPGKWAVGLLLVSAVAANATRADAKTKVVQPLSPTVHAPGAHGTAKLVLRTGSTGRFSVKARHLPAGRSFDLVVNKVKVGTITTGPSGGGVARFSTSPTGRAGMLGFDPRGAEIEVRDGDTGDDDLDSDMPDDQPDSAIGCCVGERDDDHETECEDLTATECATRGGTPTTATSCLPDPCGTNPPSPTSVCCLAQSAAGASEDDDPEVECDADVSATNCATQGGTVVTATSCDPNPCQPVPPPATIICCVPDGHESECEHVTPDHCTTAGGTPSSATSCDSDPCGGGGGGDGEDGDGGD